jgi:ShK domain-like
MRLILLTFFPCLYTKIIHEKDFFGGPFVPEFLFHRYGPLKLMTWSSLFLECTGFILVWFRPLRVAVVASMILLHVGIDMTMNMHIFEWVSIIGWLMFLFESENEDSPLRVKHDTGVWYQRRWALSVFLGTVLTIFLIDTAPLLELYDLLVSMLRIEDFPAVSNLTEDLNTSHVPSAARRAVNTLFYMQQFRIQYFNNPIGIPLLYPLGLFQGVWNLYSGAPDTFCRFEILLSTYNTNSFSADTSEWTNSDRDAKIIFQSPDWGTFNWYEKKRWQRPMTMYEKLPEMMCRDCFLQYHARLYLQRQANADLRVASLRLHLQCEQPPPPPVVDDWFNWTGWFYANAKQDVLVPMENLPNPLYLLNICDDQSVGCSRWQRDGLCEAANHQDRFTITQLCRRSCRLCPEHGYDADQLTNGTRISIIWPVPSQLDMFHVNGDAADVDNTPFYFDATITSVKNRPWKRYLLKYDDSAYDNEWFDPILLRERGYRLLERGPLPNTLRDREEDAPESSQANPGIGADEL